MNGSLAHRLLSRLLSVVTVAVLVAGFTPLRGFWRGTAHFTEFPLDRRVHFEAGVEPFAAEVAMALPEAVAMVEGRQFRSFPQPVDIYVCASPATLVAYGGPAAAGGFVLNNRVFLSAKLQNTPERLVRLLAHELSHLQLEQHVGSLGYAWNIPSWFKEGLAVLVSGGGGAESVSPAEAREAIPAGRTFFPAMTGRLLFEKSGASYGLSEHMWYRQSELLVQFLRDKDAAAFRRLLVDLADGASFRRAFTTEYPAGIDQLVAEFRTGGAGKKPSQSAP